MPEVVAPAPEVVAPAPEVAPAPDAGGGGSILGPNAVLGASVRIGQVYVDEVSDHRSMHAIPNLFDIKSRNFSYTTPGKGNESIPLSGVGILRGNVEEEGTENTREIYLIQDKKLDTITGFIDPEEVLSKNPNARIEFADSNCYVNGINQVFSQLDNDKDGITGKVFNLYQGCGRFADPGGLKFHANAIRTGKASLEEVCKDFLTSEEFSQLAVKNPIQFAGDVFNNFNNRLPISEELEIIKENLALVEISNDVKVDNSFGYASYLAEEIETEKKHSNFTYMFNTQISF